MSHAPSLTRSGNARTLSSQHDAPAYIRARVPFKAGSLTGHASGYWGPGRMPSAWAKVFYADANTIDYAVYSFSTPIAWHTPRGWTVPNVSYSITTGTKHQSKVYGLDGPIRRRIDAVTLVATNRLNNSVSGNPRYEVEFSDGRIALTSSDASVSYDVSNAARDQRPRYVDYTLAGRIRGWTVAPADNFTER